MKMTMTMMINVEQIMMTVQLLLHNQPPAHDFQHVLRVYKNAEMISRQEEGELVDLDIVLAAALLHRLDRRTEFHTHANMTLVKRICCHYHVLRIQFYRVAGQWIQMRIIQIV